MLLCGEDNDCGLDESRGDSVVRSLVLSWDDVRALVDGGKSFVESRKESVSFPLNRCNPTREPTSMPRERVESMSIEERAEIHASENTMTLSFAARRGGDLSRIRTSVDGCDAHDLPSLPSFRVHAPKYRARGSAADGVTDDDGDDTDVEVEDDVLAGAGSRLQGNGTSIPCRRR